MNGLKFATFRLGKTSILDIQNLDNRPAGIQVDSYSFVVTCTQVPDDLTVGTVVFVWLGSDNSKGMPTEWKQGFKGIGIVKALDKAPRYNDESHTTIELKYVFDEAVNRLDILRESPTAYFWCSALPIIGLDDHSNQTVRVLAEVNDRSKIGAFLFALNAVQSTFRSEIITAIPGMADCFWDNVNDPKTGAPIGRVGVASGTKGARQLITYGAPGAGKSWCVKEWTKGEDTIRTTFHPDSDYSTFVGSYKPSVEKDKFQTVVTAGERNAAGTLNKKDELFTQKHIVYKFVPQAFIKAYVDAWKYKAAANGGEATRKYLVIEEINRGNCAQIFGDLFQLLDRNDEGFSDYEIAADDDLQSYLAEQFADLAKQNETAPINLGVDAKLAKRILSGEVMLLPENLYIWATMNTSDQSLFPIDSAFKRRWEWKYMPIYDAQKDYKIVVDGDVYKWWDFLEKANALVQEFTDSEDKKLGYFFCKADASNAIPLEQFVGKVIFYLWNDVFKDAGFDHAAFDGDNGEKLLFKTFFNPDGSPKAATVKRLMQNLGVSKVEGEGA